jgi:abortive infection alpha-like protein
MDEESAKAAQEVAKTASKAIEAGEKVGGFLVKIFGDTLVELGETLHDWARYFRYKNLLSIQDRVELIHSARKLEGRTIPIPPRYALPLIQNASEEDDPTLQELWAGLIANATDPSKHLDLSRMLIGVLASLEPLDLTVLRFLNDQGWLQFRNIPGGGIDAAKLQAGIGVSVDKLRLSLQNLNRLGLVGDEYEMKFDEIDTSSFGFRVMKPDTTFRISPLGTQLLESCDPDETAEE